MTNDLKTFNTASTWRRIFAHMVDSVVSFGFYLPMWIQAYSFVFEGGSLTIDIRWLVICSFCVFLYRWMFLFFLGGTIGKLMFGLRLVSSAEPHGSLSLMQAFLRVLTDGLSLFFGYGLKGLMFLRFDRTHVSDWVAETRVVQASPRPSLPKRRVLLAVFIFCFSTFNTFKGLYHLARESSFDRGQIVINATR